MFHNKDSGIKSYSPARNVHYVPRDRKIYVPRGSANAYKYAGYWRDYADAIVGYYF